MAALGLTGAVRGKPNRTTISDPKAAKPHALLNRNVRKRSDFFAVRARDVAHAPQEIRLARDLGGSDRSGHGPHDTSQADLACFVPVGARRMTGPVRRLARIFKPPTNRSLIVPVDDSLITGPHGGLQDISAKIHEIGAARPDAVLGFAGQFEHHRLALQEAAWIFNLTASRFGPGHTDKRRVTTVRDAAALGADAVAVHVNVTSRHEGDMLEILADVISQGRSYGLPVMAIMYPRRESNSGDDNYEELRRAEPDRYTALVAHGVRIASDLGADFIKTQFTGSTRTFQTVVAAADGVPVVVAGGPLIAQESVLTNARRAIAAGARGISFGRNVFERTPSTPILDALRDVVHNSAAS